MLTSYSYPTELSSSSVLTTYTYTNSTLLELYSVKQSCTHTHARVQYCHRYGYCLPLSIGGRGCRGRSGGNEQQGLTTCNTGHRTTGYHTGTLFVHATLYCRRYTVVILLHAYVYAYVLYI